MSLSIGTITSHRLRHLPVEHTSKVGRLSTSKDDKGERRGRGKGREEILKAAKRAFASKGYAGATTSGIARDAGVTQPLVHHHFGSKEKLWDAVVSSIFQELDAYFSESFAQTMHGSTEERLRGMLRAFVRFSGHHPELGRLMTMEAVPRGEKFERLFETYIRPQNEMLHGVLAAAQAEGVLRADLDLDLAPFVIIGSSIHLFVVAPLAAKHSIDVDDPETIERYVDTVMGIVFGGILAKSQTS